MRKVLLRSVLALLALAGLLGVGTVGALWVRHATTTPFREWVRAHPVADEVWRAAAPKGAVVGRGAPWRSAEGAPGERRGQWRPRVTVQHGEEVLLDLELDVAIESREVADWRERGVPSEAFEALAVTVRRAELDPDFHAVARLSVVGLSRYADGPPASGSPQGPTLQLDVFALAGPGEVEVLVQEVEDAAGLDRPLLGDGDWSAAGASLLAMVANTLLAWERPPEDGVAYQVRCGFFPTWSRTEGGATGAGVGPWRLAGTTRLYSALLRGEQSARSPFDPEDHFGWSTSAHMTFRYTWQGEVR